MYNLNYLLYTILSFSTLFFGSCQVTKMESKPNIIIFFTDDQGYGDVGCYGASGFNTPHLDEVANNGIRFTDFYVAASVCTPSRAALLTGKYPKQVGLHESVIFPFSTHGLNAGEITLPEILKPAGYSTAIIGKWHLGHADKNFHPNSHGFDYYYGVPYSNDMDRHFYRHNEFQSPPLPVYKNSELIEEGPDQDNLTSMWTEEAVKYIQSHSNKPFFLYLAHNMPHVPWHVSEKFRGSSQYGLYGDIMQEIDWSMGEIIKTLKEQNLLNNTIVLFTSDNGQQKLKNGGSAGPLRGSKATTWEGGMRVPGIISWPARIPLGKVCKTPVTAMDILPTFASIAGQAIPSDAGIKGRDISQILFQPDLNYSDTFEFIYYARDGKPEAFRQGEWKLHIRKSRGWDVKDGEFPISLYNLKNDPGERKNLAEDNPDMVRKMKRRMKELDLIMES